MAIQADRRTSSPGSSEARDHEEFFREPRSAIGVTTFFTELAKRRSLRDELWPRDKAADFTRSFRGREQRRELLSAMARLGGAYIDLYLLAIRQAGGFDGKQEAARDRSSRGDLARSFVQLLDEQRERPGCFHAYAELSGAARAFHTLIKVNFPEAPTADLGKLAEVFGRGLQEQNPIGRMAGNVAGRVVRQFRMPGFPLVLISTDVLQEGEDLHTFCRRVIHYGITWTPSAMEQRTGRVDRIGGLAQRTLDGKASAAEPHEKIQVLYPHLEDTVERLQVRRVLLRLNRFLQLVHAETLKHEKDDPKLDTNRDMLASTDIPPPVEGKLESAFPVRDEWLKGETNGAFVRRVDVDDLRLLLDEHWKCLRKDFHLEQPGQDGPLTRHGVLRVHAGRVVPAKEVERSSTVEDHGVRLQHVELDLRSAGIADTTFLRCRSVIGHIDLRHHPEHFGQLRRLQMSLGQPRLCARWDAKHDSFGFSIEASLPFDRATTQYEEVQDLVRRVALQADRIEEETLDEDKDAKLARRQHQDAFVAEPATPDRLQAGRQPSPAHRPSGLERVRELLGKRGGTEWDHLWREGILEVRSDIGTDIVVDLAVTRSDAGAKGSAVEQRPTAVRKQRVRISRTGDEYVFATVVLAATTDARSPAPTSPTAPQHLERSQENALTLRAWSRNAETELVNFTLDPAGRLVGEIRHPVGHLDAAELRIYLQTLATEGDRFEYILTGDDEH